MSERTFYDPKARERATAAIKEIEAQTSAEVVITLRHVSGDYRASDLAFGFVVALATLIAMFYVPVRFRYASFPIDTTIAFILGALLCANVGPLRRLLVSRKRRAEAVRRGARASFIDLGVHRTHGRSGLLVYVAMFERAVEIVGDVAIDPNVVAEARAKMEQALAHDLDFEAFLAAFRSLGPALAAPFPHQDDDVNELPDEVDAEGDA